jgi:tetratricopeptide (TPR) repeat protein
VKVALESEPQAEGPDRREVGRWARSVALLLQAGDLEEAERTGRAAIDAGAADARLFDLMGVVYRRQDRLGEAVDAFRRAVELTPRVARPHGQLADLLIRSGQFDEADSELQVAIDLDPTTGALHSSLARLRQRQGRIDNAIESAERAVELEPEDQRFSAQRDALVKRREADRAKAERAVSTPAPETPPETAPSPPESPPSPAVAIADDRPPEPAWRRALSDAAQRVKVALGLA